VVFGHLAALGGGPTHACSASLHVRVVEPTLLEWTEVEPGCSEPHRWLGGYEHLKRAIELAPDDELARRKLVVLILGRVGFASYELPVGYLGAAHEDLVALSEAGLNRHVCPSSLSWISVLDWKTAAIISPNSRSPSGWRIALSRADYGQAGGNPKVRLADNIPRIGKSVSSASARPAYDHEPL
jgi:hypothetical protein